MTAASHRDPRRRALVRLHFEDCYDDGFGERDAFEALSRGYRSHVWAELDDGSRYQLTYYDVTRLAQTLEGEAGAGRPYFAEPGLIIVPEVTLANMEAAARALAAEGFFERYLARSAGPGDAPPGSPGAGVG